MAQLWDAEGQGRFAGWDDDGTEGVPIASSPAGGTHATGDGVARRLGLVGRGPVAAACALVMVALALLGIARLAPAEATLQVEGAADGASAQSDGASPDEAGQAAGNSPDVGDQADAVAEVVVHVDGAVRQPGVYHLRIPAPRVGDAVDAAGGLADDADTSAVNLAATLEDGTKVHINHQGESAEDAMSAEAGPAGGVGDGQPGLVNINTATAGELVTLPGVGDVTAQAILDDRDRNGPYRTTDDLMRVSGIGEKRYAKIRDLICV